MVASGIRSWLERHLVLRVLLLTGAGTAVFLCVGALIMHLLLWSLFRTKTEPADMATISHWTGVVFPSDETLRHSLAIHHGIDYELYAEVEMSRNDLALVIRQLKKAPYPLISRKSRLRITNSARNWRNDTPIPEWWKPDSAREFVASSPGLLISLDDPNSVTVWVHLDTDKPL